MQQDLTDYCIQLRNFVKRTFRVKRTHADIVVERMTHENSMVITNPKIYKYSKYSSLGLHVSNGSYGAMF